VQKVWQTGGQETNGGEENEEREKSTRHNKTVTVNAKNTTNAARTKRTSNKNNKKNAPLTSNSDSAVDVDVITLAVQTNSTAWNLFTIVHRKKKNIFL